jgi:hypothetical protein
MTDEQILDWIENRVSPPRNTAALDPIWLFIREHRQTGWRRRFTDRPVITHTGK